MQTSKPEEIRAAVREAYGAVATETAQGGCCGSSASCCGPTSSSSRRLGYTDTDLAAVPEGADYPGIDEARATLAQIRVELAGTPAAAG